MKTFHSTILITGGGSGNLASVDSPLSPKQLERLDKASAVSRGFLALDPVKAIVIDGLRDRIKA